MALVQTPTPSHHTGENYEADAELLREHPLDVENDVLFLKQFPSWRKNEKKRIRMLYAIADHIDESHQKATKIKVVTTSVSVASGVLSLLGLALATTTAGGSLILAAVGHGLGAVAGVTDIVTNVREDSHNKRALAQTNSVTPNSDQEPEGFKGEKKTYVTATGELVYKCGSAWDSIKKHLRALQLTRTQPHVTSAAKKLMTSGQVSARSGRQVQKAFGGTALAMTKNALRIGRAAAALSLSQDLYTLWEDWKDLKAANPTELAEELRARAADRERVLAEHTCRYRKLQRRAKRPVGSSLKGNKVSQPPSSMTEKARLTDEEEPRRP
ncbi:apolipoprotein L6-like isoform X2 [Mus pahari]|uniref:apolipoprotein L6-like isoform X2 n=1 Tax=Mus pahari TaxID=10093 RepID=UPI0011146EC2|nr:apolipoprotein L6-like isoform X2 [Mus pahari]